MFDFKETNLVLPALYLVGGFAAGFIAERLAGRSVRRLAPGRDRGYGDKLAAAQRGLWLLLGGILGTWLALAASGLRPAQMDTVAKVLQFAAVLGATVFLARVAGVLVEEWMSRAETELPSSTIFVYVVRGTILVVGFLAALGTLGISITPMLTALGVGGLAVGLALQDTLGNLFSGIQILLSRQIQPGDLIRLESGETGHVQDVTWRNTTIQLFTNDLVVVPNAKLGTSLVTNYTSMDAQHVSWVETGVAYGSDLEHVEAVTLDVAREVLREVPGGVADYEPILRFTAFADSAITLRVSLRATGYQDRWLLMHEAVKRIHRRYAQEGIEIPFPQRDVHVRSRPDS